jgi:hypothetical protein
MVGDFFWERLYPREILARMVQQDLGLLRLQQPGSESGNLGAAVMEGDPKFNATQQIPDVPYHRLPN